MKNKIILIENKEQSEYYVGNLSKFNNLIPIVMVFEAEKKLKDMDIEFKSEGDYEFEGIFDNIYNSYGKKTEEIISKIYFDYKGINLADLLYADIFRFLAYFERNRLIVEEILKRESPGEIVIFEGNNVGCASDIIKEIFDKKIGVIKIDKNDKEKRRINNLIGIVQNFGAKLILNFSGKKNIFFSGSRTLFEPLVSELLTNKNNFLVRAHLNLQKSWIIKNKYVPFYQFTSVFKNNKISSEIEKIKKDWEIKSGNTKNKIVLKKIMDLLDEKFSLAVGIIDEISSLAEKKKINLFILDDGTDFFQKLVIGVCDKYGIPSVILQHGLIGGEVRPIGKYVMAFGEKSKEKYLNFGFDSERVIITGAPQYDSFTFNGGSNKKNKKILYVVDAVNNEELVAGHHITKKNQKEILKSLFRVMKKNFPGYELVIKGRKNWDLNGLIDYVAKEEGFTNYSFFVDADKNALLGSADVVIIHYTTMGIEAMLFGKPVISYEFEGMKKWNVFSRMNNVKFVYNEKELSRAIKKSLSEKDNWKKRKKILENELYKLDGRSTKRAASFINGLLSRQ